MNARTKKIAIGGIAVGVLTLSAIVYKVAKGKGKKSDAPAMPPASASSSSTLPAGASPLSGVAAPVAAADDGPDTDTSPIVRVEELPEPHHYRVHLRSGHVREAVRAERPLLHERWPIVEWPLERREGR